MRSQFEWPADFVRIPDEEWTYQPLETLALKYDTVEHHGWYRNLEPTLDQLQSFLRENHILVDYSGGTGILVDRLFRRLGELKLGVVIVDASPKMLRLALEKLEKDRRVAFRWIRYLKEERRLQFVDEVLQLPRGADAVVSTNAVHLYYDLPGTLRSWVRILRAGAHAFIQSGNIRNPEASREEWIIDETVEQLQPVAASIVGQEERYRAFRAALADAGRMAAYAKLRRKYFLPVRPLEYYLAALQEAGFQILQVRKESIEAKVEEWYEFLSAYHDGVLGWFGGAEKVDGRPPSEEVVRERLTLLREALRRLFGNQDFFQACWTYITCRRP